MKRKRQTRHDQCLKEQENPSSTKSFRSNITAKLQTLLNGFVSELQSISEDKRQDVTLLFSHKNKEANDAVGVSTVKSAFPSLVTSDSNKVLQNFIDSAKSRISGLLNDKEQNQVSNGNNSLKNIQSSQSKTKSLSIDPLEIQINLKFQSLLFKAFDTRKANHVDEKQGNATSESISEKDLQDLSRMLQNFRQSAKKKLHASLTKERNSQSLNGSVSVRKLLVKENQPSHGTQPSINVNQRKVLNKDYQKPFVHQLNRSSHLPNISGKFSIKNAKLLKMDFLNESADGSSSPRNPFDENCMLLLSDAEKCPSYVDLSFSSESDELENHSESPTTPVPQSESEDEVIVLGEKSKTYQEVTLDEDDEGQVHESVVEKVLEKCPKKEKEVEEPVFNCPICDKSYRAQSLLQFHIKMHTHAAENQSSKPPDNHCPNSSSSSEDESYSHERPMNSSQRARKEKESAKMSKISIKKNRREKYKRRSRNKEISKSSL